MKRTNSFVIEWNNLEEIKSLAIGCTTLWNRLNYERRQAFFDERFDFEDFKDEMYNEFKDWIGSATTQQINRKNDGAWKSFFSLLKKWNKGEFNGGKPNPPRYWKKKCGDKELRILIRNDCYSIDEREIKLPFGKTGIIKGNPRWEGKQGQLEIQYDELDGCWRAYQSMEVEPKHQSNGDEVAFVDLGVIYPITAMVDGKVISYNGRPTLSEWWQLTKQIEEYQSKLKKSRNKYSSERLRRLFRERKRKFRDSINKMVNDFIERCWNNNVSKIVAGDLTNIRESVYFNKKTNLMIHNFWSHKYLIDRIRWTAENYGIELELIDERGTSSECPKCNSKEVIKRGRLFKCKECGMEGHRDAVGAINIGLAQGLELPAEVINRAMARPEMVSL